MRAPFLVAAALFLSTTAEAQRTDRVSPRWVELGPAPIAGGEYSGRVSAVACSPTDPDRYFVGGADSGVWRTTDGGATWESLTDQLPTTAIGAVALAPSDENVVYAGTGEANYANHSRYGLGLYRSTDGGDTWTHLAEDTFAGRAFARIAVDPADPQRLFVAITRAGGFPEMAAAKEHPQRAGPIGVFRSTDGGVTWTQLALPNVSASDVVFEPGSSTTLYAAIGRIYGSPDNGVYKSTDGGGTWTRLTSGLPPVAELGRIALSSAASDPQRLYALVTNPSSATGGGASTRGAFRSDDGGATWSQLGALGSIQASYGWYLCVVGVDPADEDTAFFGGLTLHRTGNAGGSFSNVTPPHVDLHAVAWDASGRLVVGDDGGVHRSTNGGQSWTPLNDGLGTIQFYAGLSTHPTDPRVVLGGTQDNGTNQREAVGVQWTQVFGGDGGWTQIDRSAPNRRFVEYQGTGNLFLTTNGGSSFGYVGGDLFGRNCFLPPFLIDPTDSTRMLYATERLFESTDGGISWSTLSGDLTTGTGAIRSLAIAPSDPDKVYIATNDGLVQASTDGGATFQVVRSGNPGWPRVTRELCVHPTEPLTVFLAVSAFDTEQVLRSADGGLTWKALDAGLPDVPVNVIAVRAALRGAPEEVFAGTDSGLFHTNDGGRTWRRYGKGLPNAPVIDLVIEEDRQRVLLTTQGRGAWRAQLEPRR